MGSFITMLIFTIPKGVYALGNAVLIFMEIATGIALFIGLIFQPRAAVIKETVTKSWSR